MIISLDGTTSAAVGSTLVELREQGGAVALGRVLTLVILANGGDIEPAVEAANRASREHPCRVVVIEPGDGRRKAGLDAEIRVGGDAGASEVVILRPRGDARHGVNTLVIPLLLPDAPIVAWWPTGAPEDPAHDPIGQIAGRRITDVAELPDPIGRLRALADTYTPGDTDLSWARTTLWRGLSAGIAEAAPGAKITGVIVRGDSARPATHLLAGWFAAMLRCKTRVEHDKTTTVISEVELRRDIGTVTMSRPEGAGMVTITADGEPKRQVAMTKRPLQDCLMEDLRHLDPDEIYARTLLKGLPKVEVA